MIEKTNIPIQNKNTKKIDYILNLDTGWWDKYEYDDSDNEVYFEDCVDFWYKYEHDTEGNIIYVENSYGYIRDDRTN